MRGNIWIWTVFLTFVGLAIIGADETSNAACWNDFSRLFKVQRSSEPVSIETAPPSVWQAAKAQRDSEARKVLVATNLPGQSKAPYKVEVTDVSAIQRETSFDSSHKIASTLNSLMDRANASGADQFCYMVIGHNRSGEITILFSEPMREGVSLQEQNEAWKKLLADPRLMGFARNYSLLSASPRADQVRPPLPSELAQMQEKYRTMMQSLPAGTENQPELVWQMRAQGTDQNNTVFLHRPGDRPN